MFDGLLENMKEQEIALRNKLAEEKVEETLQGIRVLGNANLDILSVHLDESFLSPEKKEELEDILVACLANWKKKAEKVSGEMSAGMVEGILPPGLGDIFQNFK